MSVKYWNTINTVAWQTGDERIVADAFHSKKSSSALFTNSKHHKSDVFYVAIQLLVVTTREIYMKA